MGLIHLKWKGMDPFRGPLSAKHTEAVPEDVTLQQQRTGFCVTLVTGEQSKVSVLISNSKLSKIRKM